MPYDRPLERRAGTSDPLSSQHRSRDGADSVAAPVGIRPVPGLLRGGTLLRSPGPGPTGVGGDVVNPMNDAGRAMVKHALEFLTMAQNAVAQAIPLATSPELFGQAMAMLAPARGYVDSARSLLEQGLELQGRIQRGAPPGGSVGQDGLPMDEGDWLQVRLNLGVIAQQLAAPNPAGAGALHAQLIQLVTDCHQAMVTDQIRETQRRVAQMGS
jgi:hypothetical protein